MKKVIESLKQVHSEVIENGEKISVVQKLLHKSKNPAVQQIESNLPALPIKTEEELETLEKELMDAEQRELFMKRLSCFGGTTLRSVVHTMMNNTIHKTLAVKFSLQGRRGKKKFSDLKLYECIIGKLISVFS